MKKIASKIGIGLILIISITIINFTLISCSTERSQTKPGADIVFHNAKIIGKVEKGDIGYIVQAGCLFKMSGGFFFDIKGSYGYCEVKPADIEASLGGLKAGIGVGYEF